QLSPSIIRGGVGGVGCWDNFLVQVTAWEKFGADPTPCPGLGGLGGCAQPPLHEGLPRRKLRANLPNLPRSPQNGLIIGFFPQPHSKKEDRPTLLFGESFFFETVPEGRNCHLVIAGPPLKGVVENARLTPHARVDQATLLDEPLKDVLFGTVGVRRGADFFRF